MTQNKRAKTRLVGDGGRWIGAAGALCIAALGAWFWLRPAPTPVAKTQRELVDSFVDTPPRTSGPAPIHEPDPDRLRSRAALRPDPYKPTITLAKVDKTEVCRGEENFLNVEAHTDNGTDAFLLVWFENPVSGEIVRGGSRIPFRLDAPTVRSLEVVVEGGRGTATRVTLPPIKVKDCDAPTRVVVKQSRSMETPDRVTLTAEIKEPGDSGDGRRQPFVATDFEWDFGDGERQRTKEASIEHSYEGRVHTALQSSFVVSVKARDARGVQASGTQSVVFVNLGFSQLVHKGRVTLAMGMAPADAKSGKPAQRWLYHGHSRPVHLNRVKLREVIFDSDHHEVELSKQDYAPGQVLGFSRLDPKTSQPLRDWSEFIPTEPGHARLIEVSGSTDDGKQVLETFSLVAANATSTTGDN